MGLQGVVSTLHLQLHAERIQPGVLAAAFSHGGPGLWPCFGMPKMSVCKRATALWRATVTLPVKEGRTLRKGSAVQSAFSMRRELFHGLWWSAHTLQGLKDGEDVSSSDHGKYSMCCLTWVSTH